MAATAVEQNGLAQTVEQIRAHLGGATDEQATATFRVQTRLLQNVSTEAQIRQFALRIDEPTTLGGDDTGPSPVEVVLAALGTCQEIVYAYYAAALGVPLEKVEVDVEGDLDPRGFFGVADVANGFSHVRYHVRLASPAPEEQVRRLRETVDRHCPVLDILQKGLPVVGTAELNGVSLT